MLTVMSAEEAREIMQNMSSKHTEKCLGEIQGMIDDAIEKDETFILCEAKKVPLKVKSALEDLGYVVTQTGDSVTVVW